MAETDATAGPTRHFLTFRLLDRLYGMPANEVAEVIRIPSVARLPQSPKGLLGLANLRGAILAIASGRSLLGQDEQPSASKRAIVLQGASPVAFAVDEVAELVTVAESTIDSAALSALPGEILSGAFASAKGVVKWLDIQALMRTAFVAPARGARRAAIAASHAFEEEAGRASTKLVSFAVAGQDYALPLAIVQEIVEAPAHLASVPHSDVVVLGITSLRERLLPLLSLRALLGFAAVAVTGREKVVIATVQGHLVGLLVDEMRAIFAVDDSKIDVMPEVLAARSGGESRIAALYRGEAGLVSILSAEQIFGDDVMQRLAGTQHETAAPSEVGAASETLQFLVFRLGGEEFGLPIGAVEEVARVPDKIARLPNTPKFLEGVINLRGEVLPVVDQRKRFAMAALPGSAGRRLIVVRSERHLAGLIVDSVSEVLRYPAASLESAPDLTGEAGKLVTGVVNLEAQGRIVLLLDPQELLTRSEKGLLDKFAKQQANRPLA